MGIGDALLVRSGYPVRVIVEAITDAVIHRDYRLTADMFEQLGSNELEVPVTTDIAGKKDAHSVCLDREASDAIKKANLHRKVAAAILFESNGGMSQAKAVATLPEIRAAVSSPDLNMVDIDNVLEGLVGACYYLNWDRNRYRFGLTSNLNQILVTEGQHGDLQTARAHDRWAARSGAVS